VEKLVNGMSPGPRKMAGRPFNQNRGQLDQSAALQKKGRTWIWGYQTRLR
jgi:hypothetical protein